MYLALPDWVVLFIWFWREPAEVSVIALMKEKGAGMRGKVSIITLMMDKKSKNGKKSVHHSSGDGQKEREIERKCPS
ncbi:hypothetical protein J7E38_14315 [Bacillus sp. ISL-35]|uniref:hypothetical protein n=1 Tax=Bacillus sp. ISL-35 TaxID=2819122 RepID=UPI001BEBFBDD|nr:hypothetical protein [Bacillus sp. ISL-35]MBT2680186.1 hypothetical protein [Bacillus sp. ISL-35]MBT2704460.1 hypothetical protein [Chryseobacterium sp. ISL-80]